MANDDSYIEFKNYFDIHAHILPEVDDGATDLTETVNMLKLAASENITTIIATPHYVCGRNNPEPDYLEKLRLRVQKEAYDINKDMRILLGNEIFYSESVIEDLKRGKALTLAGSRYVLVEFSISESYNTIYNAVTKLINNGYWPVLAHAERYICLYKRTDLIKELIKAGCYIQVNASGIVGNILNSKAVYLRKLISSGLVHFLGSDCHDCNIRPPIMETAVRYMIKKCDINLSEILYENPFKILENNYI